MGFRRSEEEEIKASPQAQQRLLALQGVDTALAQLAHRRRTLPEHGVLANLAARQKALAEDIVESDTAVSDLELEQAKAEADLEPVRQRLLRDQQRIADGSVKEAKALTSLVDEVAHLQRRIGDLEDAELEVMEALETAQHERGRRLAQAAELSAEQATTTAKRDRQLAELDEEVRAQRETRAAITLEVPVDLLTLYTKIAGAHGGVGAAELRQRRCAGCRLEVSSADLRRFAAAPDDEVLRCEECSRILIRTPESGF